MITLGNFRQVASSADGEIRLAPDGQSLNVQKDGMLMKVKRLFSGAESACVNRDVRFAFVQAVRKAGASVSPTILRELGLAESSKVSASARPLTCRAVRGLLEEVCDAEKSVR